MTVAFARESPERPRRASKTPANDDPACPAVSGARAPFLPALAAKRRRPPPVLLDGGDRFDSPLLPAKPPLLRPASPEVPHKHHGTTGRFPHIGVAHATQERNGSRRDTHRPPRGGAAARRAKRKSTDRRFRGSARCRCSSKAAVLGRCYPVNSKSYRDATRAMTSGVSGADCAASARSRM
jgi:hypothetical protein